MGTLLDLQKSVFKTFFNYLYIVFIQSRSPDLITLYGDVEWKSMRWKLVEQLYYYSEWLLKV